MSLISHSLQQSVRKCLLDYQAAVHSLPGIRDSTAFNALVSQLFDSIRRVEYVFALQGRELAAERTDPKSEAFDPLKAAILAARRQDFEEACWLVFLLVHFGKNFSSGWRLLRSVYGALDSGSPWTWGKLNSNPKEFRSWIAEHHNDLKGAFGNHRKYISLRADSPNGTAAAVESYFSWVLGFGSHSQLRQVMSQQVNDPGVAFDRLYRSMRVVKSFGRTARFDYLTMLGKLKLFPIEPASPYIQGATGPRRGAALLLHGATDAKTATEPLETELTRLGNHLSSQGVRFSMQVLEDGLCNWQKSPRNYLRFRG